MPELGFREWFWILAADATNSFDLAFVCARLSRLTSRPRPVMVYVRNLINPTLLELTRSDPLWYNVTAVPATKSTHNQWQYTVQQRSVAVDGSNTAGLQVLMFLVTFSPSSPWG